ncbi:efflux RND transporter permease subunit [Streptomyces sp. NPDC048639]|uniref:efflux RND transporter permease subunit n=1 Tax=Streptomyces sp. NPDC048639 TaxID=3365581 RepID=UPI00371F3351
MIKLTSFSMRNRALVAFVMLAITGVGLLALPSLRQQMMPDVSFPKVSVTASYPGASPQVVEDQVAVALEQAVRDADGVLSVTTTSRSGSASVVAEFDFGVSADDSTATLRDAVNEVEPRLPDGVETEVVAGSTEDLPAVQLAAARGTGDGGKDTDAGDGGAEDRGAEGEDTADDDAQDGAGEADGKAGKDSEDGEGGRDEAEDADGEKAFADRLDSAVVPELEAIDGVREVKVTGVRDERVTVTLDSDALADAGLTPADVTQSLQNAGAVLPSGALTEDDTSYAVSVDGELGSVKDLRELYVTPSGSGAATGAGAGATGRTGDAPRSGAQSGGPNGGQSGAPSGAQSGDAPAAGAGKSAEPVRLEDVATVRQALAPSTTLTRTNGEPTLGVAVTPQPDADTVGISHAVRDALPGLEKKLGDGADLTVVFDQAPAVEKSIDDLTTEGGLGLAFAVVVILLFLVSVRSTLVTAVSIPLSVLIALIALWAWDYTLNLLTLGALTVAVGRVVDDSIVVLENIKRHLGLTRDKGRAVTDAVREVAGAVTSSTVTTVAVFLPIAFVGGIVGQLFGPFAITVTVALLASLLVSLTVVPVLAYWFLKAAPAGERDEETSRKEKAHTENGTSEEEKKGAAGEKKGDAAERKKKDAGEGTGRTLLQRAYLPFLTTALRFRGLTLLAALAILGATVALVPLLSTNFLGNSGQNTFTIRQTMPPGSSLRHTGDAAKKVEAALADVDDIDTYQLTVGGQAGVQLRGGGTASDSGTATYSITASPDADQAAVERELRDAVASVKGAGEIAVEATEAGGLGGSSLEVLVQAPDDATLEKATEQVRRTVRDTPRTEDVTTDLTEDMPQVTVVPDKRAAAEKEIGEDRINQAVTQALDGTRLGEVSLGGESSELVVRTGDPTEAVDALEDTTVFTPQGRVRLDKVADVEVTHAPASVKRIDGARAATVTARATTEDTGAVSKDLKQSLDKLRLPDGASYALGGTTSQQDEAFGDMGLALGVAVLLVFVIMVATFRSLLQPLILMVSVPFAATGALGLLVATGTPLGLPALIGLLMLVGIVVTNAIVLIDLVNQRRRAGLSAHSAIVEGAGLRLRPILMTALATICALLPMAFGLTGGGAFISQPLAIVVIGGLVSSTLLTLILVPVLYSLADAVRNRSRRRPASGEPAEPGGSDAPGRAEAGEEPVAVH